MMGGNRSLYLKETDFKFVDGYPTVINKDKLIEIHKLLCGKYIKNVGINEIYNTNLINRIYLITNPNIVNYVIGYFTFKQGNDRYCLAIYNNAMYYQTIDLNTGEIGSGSNV